MAQGRPLAEGGRGATTPSTWVVEPMSESDSAALQNAATTESRRIDPDRITRALTESMTVREHAPAQYLVARDGDDHEEHLVDVKAGTCDGEDAYYRDVVCVHMVRASLHHLFAHGADTRLVARVAGAVADLGCPHGNDCDGPCEAGQFPCPACVRSTNTGDWTVYQRLVAREPAAAVDTGEGVATDGGEPVEDATRDVSPCPGCGSLTVDDTCGRDRCEGADEIAETPL